MPATGRTWLITTALAGALCTSAACTGHATSADGAKAIDATRAAGEHTADIAKDAARTAADKATVVAGEVADESKKVASATAAAVSDGWITTKLKAKFADETALAHSDIHVVTSDHVVTLTGTVASKTARTRADEIAKGTDGVTHVVDQIVVK